MGPNGHSFLVKTRTNNSIKRNVLKVIGEHSNKLYSCIHECTYKWGEWCTGNNQNCKSQVYKSQPFPMKQSFFIHILLLLSFTCKSNYALLNIAFIFKVQKSWTFVLNAILKPWILLQLEIMEYLILFWYTCTNPWVKNSQAKDPKIFPRRPVILWPS